MRFSMLAVILSLVPEIALAQHRQTSQNPTLTPKHECQQCSKADREEICLTKFNPSSSSPKSSQRMTPDAAIKWYTDLIADANKNGACDEQLAVLYKMRGLAWQLKGEQPKIGAPVSQVVTKMWVIEIAPKEARKSWLQMPDYPSPEQNLSDSIVDLHSLPSAFPDTWEKKVVVGRTSHLDSAGTTDDLRVEAGLLVDMDVKDFTESLSLNPVQADVYAYRGLSLLTKAKGESLDGFCSEAIDDFDRALRIDDKNICACFWRAAARLRQQTKNWNDWNAKQSKSNKAAKDAAAKAKETDQKNLGKAGGAARKPPTASAVVTEAQRILNDKKKALDKASLDFTYATTRVDAEKENWTGAKKELAIANQAYFSVAQKLFEAADKDLKARKTEWETARGALLAETADYNTASAALTKAQQAKAMAENSTSPLEEMKAELNRAIADYSDVLRLAPADAQAIACRNDATDLLGHVEQMLRRVKPKDDAAE